MSVPTFSKKELKVVDVIPESPFMGFEGAALALIDTLAKQGEYNGTTI